MKGRVLLLDMAEDGTGRAALVVDGRLEDLLVDPPAEARRPSPGEIYWAKVERSAARTGGAFVRLGPGHSGFLREGGTPEEGAGVLVQVVSYPEAGKATPVSRRVLYKTRLVIHTPDAPGINVSRRIARPDERARLTALAEAALADAPDAAAAGGGLILRSAASGATADEIARQVADALAGRARVEAQTRAAPGSLPALAGPASAPLTAVREWTEPLPSAIVASPDAHRVLAATDDAGVATSLHASATLLGRLRACPGAAFDEFDVAGQIEALARPEAPLPSGGSLVVEATRALVAVDVNTGGRFSGGAALAADLEAARELPRQLRLRGLGGQVVVDFAPVAKKDRRRVEDALKTAFRRDPVETSLAGWTTLGLFELSRKRERRPLG